mgnify:CR=1 FL=1
MDKIDIYNDSAIILERKTPKSIISWITILILVLIVFIIFSFIPFNIYKNYSGYINIDNKNTYLIISLEKSDFPIVKNNILYIHNKCYKYKIISIKDNIVTLDVKLDDNLKIENNIVLINVLKEKTTLYKIIKNKIKKGLGI